MNLKEEALKLHKINKGKIKIESKIKLKDVHTLSLVYSPGVAEPCLEIKKDKNLIYEYTSKSNMIAIISDGSAVLGLGNIGARASLPVMEGKAILFKKFANIDAFPICIETQNTEKIISIIKLISVSFGGVNLEDIASPRCFEIEKRLEKELDIPVFHDDQHGTAIVTVAGLINALRLSNKKIEDVKIVINGAGAGGIAIVKLLHKFGARQIIMCDREGIIYKGRKKRMNKIKEEMSKLTNLENITGDLTDSLHEADVFIGVSAGNLLTSKMIKLMKKNPIVFALANPIPEIMPEEAKKAGVFIIATGRSDYPNQINNVLGFPGIFRGLLEIRAKKINYEMKIAATWALANIVKKKELNPNYIIPHPFNKCVSAYVAEAIAQAGMKTNVAKITIDSKTLKNKILKENKL